MNTTCPRAGRFWANVLYDINMPDQKLSQKVLLIVGLAAALLLASSGKRRLKSRPIGLINAHWRDI